MKTVFYIKSVSGMASYGRFELYGRTAFFVREIFDRVHKQGAYTLAPRLLINDETAHLT